MTRWGGASWHTIGTADGGNEVPVFALAFDAAGTLYAGGFFTAMDGVVARSIARWDGVAWSALGDSQSTIYYSQIYALAIGPDGDLYVGGGFPSIGGSGASSGIVRWDGTAWNGVGGGLDGSGAFRGSAWAVATVGLDVFVGGQFLGAGGVVSPNLVRYTPAAVDAEPDAASALSLSLTVSPNPASSAATATVSHPAGPVSVDLFDALGRRLVRLSEGDAPAGRREVALPVAGLAPGVYVVRLVAGREVVARPFVVAR